MAIVVCVCVFFCNHCLRASAATLYPSGLSPRSGGFCDAAASDPRAGSAVAFGIGPARWRIQFNGNEVQNTEYVLVFFLFCSR